MWTLTFLSLFFIHRDAKMQMEHAPLLVLGTFDVLVDLVVPLLAAASIDDGSFDFGENVLQVGEGLWCA